MAPYATFVVNIIPNTCCGLSDDSSDNVMMRDGRPEKLARSP